MKIIFDNLPDVLDEKYNKVDSKGNTARYNLIVNMPGFSHKSTLMFVDYLDKFKEFMQKSNLTHLYNQKPAEINEDNPFYGKNIVFTGCRNKELEKYQFLHDLFDIWLYFETDPQNIYDWRFNAEATMTKETFDEFIKPFFIIYSSYLISDKNNKYILDKNRNIME